MAHPFEDARNSTGLAPADRRRSALYAVRNHGPLVTGITHGTSTMLGTDRAGPPRARASGSATEWTQRVGGYAGLPMLIRQLGADPDTLLASVGLASDAFDDENGRVPYAALGRLLLVAAESTACTHLGLLAGRMWRLSELGVLGTLAHNSATIGDAVRALTRHQHLDSEGGVLYLSTLGEMVEIGYAVYHPDVVGT